MDSPRFNVEIDIYRERLEERIIGYLAQTQGLTLDVAMDCYYRSRLAGQINAGTFGMDNLDYKYLAEDLVENEPELFVGTRPAPSRARKQ